jgi:hypothetical protein
VNVSSNAAANVMFSSAFPAGTNVMVTLGIRERSGRLSGDHCVLTVSNVTLSGFTVQWRDVDGTTSCGSSAAVVVNYIAVPTQ